MLKVVLYSSNTLFRNGTGAFQWSSNEQITGIIIDGNSTTHNGSHGNVAVIENSDQCLQSGESIANGGRKCSSDSKYCSQFCWVFSEYWSRITESNWTSKYCSQRAQVLGARAGILTTPPYRSSPPTLPNIPPSLYLLRFLSTLFLNPFHECHIFW